MKFSPPYSLNKTQKASSDLIRNLIEICMFVFCMILASCSSIINGSTEDLTVMASPSDATITIDSVYRGEGLFKVNVDRGKVHTIEVSKDGYRTARIETGVDVAGWYWGNFLSWGIIGMITDLISRAAFGIDPDPVLVVLSPGTGKPDVRVHDTNGYIQAALPVILITAFYVWLIIEASHGGGSFM
jgi:hypothetical protein